MDDYAVVAHLYDQYVRVEHDLPWFRQCSSGAARVLELMAGTGRVSEALAEARAELTCVDRSRAMLSQLRRRPALATALVVCADARNLPLTTRYDLAVLPFNSFAEVTDPPDQVRVLNEIRRVLEPGGRFVCTLHNPVIRRRTLDGITREIARFTTARGAWTVTATGSLTGERAARSVQRYVCRNEAGDVVERLDQTVGFALVEPTDFEAMARRAGFTVESLVGDYGGGSFEPASSPFLIWTLR